MSRHVEPLNGGLVTDLDDALLEEGELSDLQNAVYKPGFQGLQRARGRSSYGVASADHDVVGLRDVQFDNGDNVLIGYVSANGGTYVTGDVGDTGTLGIMTSGVGVGTQLERAHFRNRFYLFNGVSSEVSAINNNRCMYLSATGAGQTPLTRQHGMLPVQSSPRITTANGNFGIEITGYYEYWTTEVAKVQTDGGELVLESAFRGDPTTVFVSATSVEPTIERPAIVNVGFATHWRIYRSVKKERETDVVFPDGFMVAELATGAATQNDTNSTSDTGGDFQGARNTTGELFSIASAQATAWAADDGVYGTLVNPGGLSVPAQQGVYAFNFGGFQGNVRGIEVEVQCFSSVNPTPLTVGIGVRDSLTGGFLKVPSRAFGIPYPRAAYKSAVVTSTTGPGQTLTFGGSDEKWVNTVLVDPFTDDDFGTDFMVVLGIANAATLSVDYVKVTVYYAGSIESVIQFPSIVYTFGDITSKVGKNGPPPSASTGDVFRDQLVVNDPARRALLFYSFPGEPESFPDTYFMPIETPNNDEITAIRTCNDRLIVGLRRAVARVNYLPSERDASLQRGDAYDYLTRTFGCVNAMCMVVYSPDGGTERCAWVSDKGIHSTDGYDFRNEIALDWRQIQSTSSTSTPIALIDDPENEELLFYFRNDALGTESYKCLHLSYSSEHRTRRGHLKASGLVNMRNWNSGASVSAVPKSAWSVPRTNGDTSIYIGYGGASGAGGGSIYRETGSSLPAQDPAYKYTTRCMYHAGFGGEWRATEIYEYGERTGSQPTMFTGKNRKTNDTNGEVNVISKEKTQAGERLSRIQFPQLFEGGRIAVEVTGGHDDRRSELLIIDGEGWGQEDSGL